MANINENTVSAKNQMRNASDVSFLGDPEAKNRILIVGNSITRHGPCKEIGWDRDWGMAASAPEKDYVHLLFSMLTEAGKDVYLRISQCADWEVEFRKGCDLSVYDDDRNFQADIVVFRLGENVAAEDRPYFKEAMPKFIEHICPTGKVFYTTCFWENTVIDRAIQAVAAERGEVWIDACFSKEEANMALGAFEHSGVSMHPSDAGMECIAKAIFEMIKGEIE